MAKGSPEAFLNAVNDKIDEFTLDSTQAITSAVEDPNDITDKDVTYAIAKLMVDEMRDGANTDQAFMRVEEVVSSLVELAEDSILDLLEASDEIPSEINLADWIYN